MSRIIYEEKITEAREMRELWIEAEKALVHAKSYKIGPKTLTRVDLPQVVSRIKYWDDELESLENGTGASMRVVRAVPRDI